ncbi:hypothetical protein P872_04830 [Rhodonellum psychrophilum GCM71 = DSM 17998]|uniref:DinB-like domain-containing protein n=2 Tax=Rhodonellum TaxID=336827 RepID=U5BQT3_9BACT|nr:MULTISPECIES: DinB family protein [Rhodonellum]ERM82940.1 hypothetical protein P872_04830 [Rhodonellum psychrophilum GCM71 = DSM 17998]SDZ36799.1 DinB superfamily protein [Rhodonellum ikkaensis]
MDKKNRWINELNAVTEAVTKDFGILSSEILLLKANPNEWSISENLDHLIKVNSSYFPIFKKLKNGTFRGAFIGKFGFFTKMFGDMIYKSVSDGGKKKIKTFPLWEPNLATSSGNILDQFKSHQAELIDWITQMAPFIDSKAIIHSPANKLIVYTLEKAFEIIVAHEKRHLEQAKRVLTKIQDQI